MLEKRKIYVIGHRNPDTDSICSAIATADLKNKTDRNGNFYVAARAGQLNPETEYVLKKFHANRPVYLNNIGTRVRDMEIRHINGVSNQLSMKKAWNLMAELNAVTLPIVDGKNRREGIITINDIATSYMEEQDSTIRS